MSVLAIPVLEVGRVFGNQVRCGGAEHAAVEQPYAVFAFIQIAYFVALANYELFGYLFVISGRHDPKFPRDRHKAVIISFALFLCLILLCAALYFIILPCLHFAESYGGLSDKTAADVVNYFYFSAVTITTLGYGDLNPTGHIGGELVAAAEAINGLIAFGVFTGALAGLIASRARSSSE